MEQHSDGHRRPHWPGSTAPPWPRRLLRLARPNMSGGDVRSWQRQMRERGWAIGVDGDYGPQSEAVCRRFQQDSTDHQWRLDVDGVVGRSTWRASWERPAPR